MLNIVLFGPPGAGKGTQSDKLKDKYQLVHLSTGEILRDEVKKGTKLGLEAKKFSDQGLLAPDEVVIGIIESKLDQHKDAKGFIFDGFPRTTRQAEVLDNMLNKKGTPISMMLALEVDNEELIRRLLNRGKDSDRPDDKDPVIIQKRITEYNNKTAPLKDYYSKQNKFSGIKGVGSVEEIFASLAETIDKSHKK